MGLTSESENRGGFVAEEQVSRVSGDGKRLRGDKVGGILAILTQQDSQGGQTGVMRYQGSGARNLIRYPRDEDSLSTELADVLLKWLCRPGEAWAQG